MEETYYKTPKLFQAHLKIRALATSQMDMSAKIRLMILSCAVGMRDYEIVAFEQLEEE